MWKKTETIRERGFWLWKYKEQLWVHSDGRETWVNVKSKLVPYDVP